MLERKAFILTMIKERPAIIRKPPSSVDFGKQSNENELTSPFYQEITNRCRRMNETEERISSILVKVRSEMPQPFTVINSTEEKDCSICIAGICQGEKVYKMDCCGQKFHTECLDPWLLKGKKSCPICRHSVLT